MTAFCFEEPKFQLGQLLISSRAMVNLSLLDFAHGVQRHSVGDWGDVGIRGRRANSRAIKNGGALSSQFSTHNRVKFCVITSEDRTSTSIMLKAEKSMPITFELISTSRP